MALLILGVSMWMESRDSDEQAASPGSPTTTEYANNEQSASGSSTTANTEGNTGDDTGDDTDEDDGEGASRSTSTTRRPTTTTTKRTTTTRRATTTTRKQVSRTGLPLIDVADLPEQAIDVIDDIEAGGPFQYDRDGVTFQNRERILPNRERGWYHEYTVRTPGESDRGARRLVTGRDGSLFYTDDHYDSFSEVDIRLDLP